MDIRAFWVGLAVCCGVVSAEGGGIDALLGRMTPEEKVGQLVQLGSAGYASDDQSKVAISDELRTAIREGRVGSLIGACGVKKFNELQRIAKEESRLGIPLMVGHDVIHGCRTVLPIPLGLSCSWDEGLWRRGAEMMAVEALSRGCNWTFNPMVDISRDARWGRIAESPGQDPLLSARYAAAMVKGYQGENPSDGRHIAACLKHYLAYGACEGGRDYNTVELSDDTLRNVYLPPFAAGVAAGAMTVMPAFHAINGEPCSANRYLLTDILRSELGFTGFTISDYNAVGELASGHAVAESPAVTAVLSMNAGMDMDMMSGSYRGGLIQAVRDGRVSMKTLDTAVRRILSVKARLGLFERPYIDADILDKIDIKAHHALAREAAAKSVVLIKNERRVLPLKAGQKIVLLGALSGDRDEMLGCWQTWKDGFENATVREGLVADGAVVEYVSAYTPTGAVDRAAIRAAVEKADVVVASFGESCWDYGSMNGENCSRADIGLPGRQLEAVEEIKASGKSFVALLFCGRPLAVPELLSAADAVVVAWNPGSSGGWGVADVLTGRSEPYGRLTVDFPHKTGECPLYYNRLPTGRPWKSGKYWVTKYIDAPSPGRSLLCFGQGLAYTTFTYADENVAVDGSNVVFSATVANTGARTGSEVVQVYVRDLVASVSRPRRELKGFVRVTLKPGESRTVRVAVPRCELGFWHQGKYAVEQGEFAAWIAPDSDSGRELRFRLTEAPAKSRVGKVGAAYVMKGTPTPQMRTQWQGKKIAFLGDSLTDYAGCPKKYWYYLADILGADVFAYGWCGCRMSGVLKQAESVATELGDEVDAIFVLAGTNDFNGSVPRGEWYVETEKMTQRTQGLVKLRHRALSMDEETFRGRINRVMGSLKRDFPRQQIVLMTTPHRGLADYGPKNLQPDESHANLIGAFIDDYNEDIRDAGRIWSVPVLDLYERCGLLPTEKSHATFFCDPKTDLLHPNEEGNRRIAMTMACWMQTIPADFKEGVAADANE